MTRAKDLLSIYSRRLKMQRDGTTKPSEQVQAVTKRLVEKLASLDSDEWIEIEANDSVYRWVRKSTGEVLAELIHSK